MSHNILQIVHDVVDDAMLHEVAHKINEPSWNTSVALNDALHAILGGVMKHIESPQGAGQVLQALEGFDDDVLNNVESIVTGGELQNFAEIGMALTDFVFASQRDFLVKVIANHAEARPAVCETLVGFAAPLVFAALRRHHAQHTLDEESLGELLRKQKPYLAHEACSDLMLNLGLGDLLRASDSELEQYEAEMEEVAKAARPETGINHPEPPKRKSLIPQLAAIAVILGGLGYLGWPRIPRTNPSNIVGRILKVTGTDDQVAGDAADVSSTTMDTGVVTVNGVPQPLETSDELSETEVDDNSNNALAVAGAPEPSRQSESTTPAAGELAGRKASLPSLEASRSSERAADPTHLPASSSVPTATEEELTSRRRNSAADPVIAEEPGPATVAAQEHSSTARRAPAGPSRGPLSDDQDAAVQLLAIGADSRSDLSAPSTPADIPAPHVVPQESLDALKLQASPWPAVPVSGPPGPLLAADVAEGSTLLVTSANSALHSPAFPTPAVPLAGEQPSSPPASDGFEAHTLDRKLDASDATVAAETVTTIASEPIPTPPPVTRHTSQEHRTSQLTPYRRHREHETFYREPAAKNWSYFRQPRGAGFTYRHRLN